MGVRPQDLMGFVINPTLERVGLYSAGAAHLLLGTAAQESRLGEYLSQLDAGPARGIWQMEIATHDDIWNNYLDYRPELVDTVLRACGMDMRPQDASFALRTNLAYACVMARLVYRRAPEAIPSPEDIRGAAKLWKKRYNTPLGRGTVAEYVQNWQRLVESQW